MQAKLSVLSATELCSTEVSFDPSSLFCCLVHAKKSALLSLTLIFESSKKRIELQTISSHFQEDLNFKMHFVCVCDSRLIKIALFTQEPSDIHTHLLTNGVGPQHTCMALLFFVVHCSQYPAHNSCESEYGWILCSFFGGPVNVTWNWTVIPVWDKLQVSYPGT